MCIKEGNEHKAAFKMCYGLYEPTIMFFRLMNSPATFQTMMNHIFHPIIARHELLGTSIRVYMDDIAIATCMTNTDHTATVCDILTLMRNMTFISNQRSAFSTPPASITWG